MIEKARFWEQGYADRTVWAMGGPSLEVFELEQKLPRAARVLDLGCGDGRNAVFLALKGHKVTALELSSNAVQKLRALSKKFALDITVIEGRIEDFRPAQTYDLVLAHCSLHFVTKDIWVPLVETLHDLTAEGGFHNITSFIGTPEFPIPHECRHANSFERGDLDKLYAGWQTIRSDFYAKWDAHPGIPMHVHVVEKFVARKADRAAPFPFAITKPDIHDPLSETDFDRIPLGKSLNDLQGSDIHANRINRTRIPSITLGDGGAKADDYLIEDVFFGNRALQITRGTLTGKYLYFTDPVYLSA